MKVVKTIFKEALIRGNIDKDSTMGLRNIKKTDEKPGIFTIPDFCPRCFWIKLHMRFKLPFKISPGIFSSIDSYLKKDYQLLL